METRNTYSDSILYGDLCGVGMPVYTLNRNTYSDSILYGDLCSVGIPAH